MSKFVKGLIQNEMEKKFEGVDFFVVVETKGVDGNANNTIRGRLLEKDIKLTVVKNSLMRKALDKLGLAAASSLFMAGPCTVAYGGESVVDIAKEIMAAKKEFKALGVKGAFVDGNAVDSEGVTALSKMPSKVELMGEVVMLANSPGRRVAGAISGPGGIIAGCVKGLIDKLEEAA